MYTPTKEKTAITFIISLIILGLIQGLLIPGIVSIAGKFELFFVNTIGLPFNYGTIIYFLILISAIIYGLKWSKEKAIGFIKEKMNVSSRLNLDNNQLRTFNELLTNELSNVLENIE